MLVTRTGSTGNNLFHFLINRGLPPIHFAQFRGGGGGESLPTYCTIVKIVLFIVDFSNSAAAVPKKWQAPINMLLMPRGGRAAS